MNLLLTGANGLIGQNLVDDLLKNTTHNIFLISRNDHFLNSTEKLQTIFHDLLFPILKIKFLKELIVIHLAAIAHESNSNVMFDNCKMTKNITSAFLDKKVRFVLFSSVAVYGEASRKFPLESMIFVNPFPTMEKVS